MLKYVSCSQVVL